MIQFVKDKNLFDYVGIPIIPVNTVGVMGKGLALTCKNKYPVVFYYYSHYCRTGLLTTKTPVFIHLGGTSTLHSYVCLFVTKKDWRDPSQLNYITDGLPVFLDKLKRRDPVQVLIPKLGCGLGGLDWDVVKPIIINSIETDSFFENINFIIFE